MKTEDSNQATALRSRPLVAWGEKVPIPGDAPRGVIGVAIHKATRASGQPGREAARAEATVLAAIVSDPVLALWDPVSIRGLGARIPLKVAIEVSSLVAQEAERVIADIQVRAEAGDPVALRWIDPDSWSFQHEEEPQAIEP